VYIHMFIPVSSLYVLFLKNKYIYMCAIFYNIVFVHKLDIFKMIN
jgi:hypothetical protein